MTTNSLVYKTSKALDGQIIKVTIRLNDECKNGHQDFAITADIYESGKPGRNKWIAGGCCHEEILKAFPEFKCFVDLHLCDYLGNPMYAIENGYYNLHRLSTPDFCKTYNISVGKYQKLKTADSQQVYAYLLKDLGITADWKAKADAAIRELERLTGDTFLVDSIKTNFHE